MKNILLFASVIVLFTMIGCKTTEENYRSAYELAKQKQYDTGDSLSTLGLKNELTPKMVAFGSDTLPTRIESVSLTKSGGGSVSGLRRFCVAVGDFRQIFNAKSLRERLIDAGYADAFLLRNRMDQYYVIAITTTDAHTASMVIDSLKSDSTLVLKAPYPYVLQPVHLAK